MESNLLHGAATESSWSTIDVRHNGASVVRNGLTAAHNAFRTSYMRNLRMLLKKLRKIPTLQLSDTLQYSRGYIRQQSRISEDTEQSQSS